MKNVLFLLSVFAISIGASAQKSEDKLTELFSYFGEVPQEMSNDDLQNIKSNYEALDEDMVALLEEDNLMGSTFYPIGKFTKGSMVTMIYAEINGEESSNPNLVTINSKTLHKKTGEIDNSQHYVLTSGMSGSTMYKGSFKRVGKDQIEFREHSTEKDGKKGFEGMRYNLGKYLEFDEHLEE